MRSNKGCTTRVVSSRRIPCRCPCPGNVSQGRALLDTIYDGCTVGCGLLSCCPDSGALDRGSIDSRDRSDSCGICTNLVRSVEGLNCPNPRRLFRDNGRLSLDVIRPNSSLENGRNDLDGSCDHIDKRFDLFCASVC